MAKLPSGWIIIPRMKDATHIELEERRLVTCAECKYWNPMNRIHQDYHPGRGECKLICWVSDSDWFCADGEAKEDEE